MVGVDGLLTVLASLPHDSSLHRGSALWRHLVNWLRYVADSLVEQRGTGLDEVLASVVLLWLHGNRDCCHGEQYSSGFYPRDTMLAQILAVVLCLSVCLSVCLCICLCLSQVSVPSKGVNRLVWFWHGGFFRPVLALCSKKIQVSTHI